MNPFEEVVIDGDTADLLNLISSSKSVDVLRLVKIIGADTTTFREFLLDSGRLDDESAKKILHALQENKASSATPHNEEISSGSLNSNEINPRSRERVVYKGGHRSRAKTAASKTLTKMELYHNIATATDVSKRDVAAIFEALAAEVKKAMGRNGAKVFTIPGLCKIYIRPKPATKARKGINPFTGEMSIFKAKRARNVIKITALKNLKEML